MPRGRTDVVKDAADNVPRTIHHVRLLGHPQLSMEKDGTRDLALIAHKPTYSVYPHKTALPFESDVAKILYTSPVRLREAARYLRAARQAHPV